MQIILVYADLVGITQNFLRGMMEIKLTNLGPLKCASISLADFTVVCGTNNTGKTYATYAIFGFLSFWWEAHVFDLDSQVTDTLLETGNVSLSISDLAESSQQFIDAACQHYNRLIGRVLSTEQSTISEARLEIKLDSNDIQPLKEYEQTIGTDAIDIFSISKEADKDEVSVSLLVKKGSLTVPIKVLQRSISNALKQILFRNTIPEPKILVAERTGIEIFQSELDFARNRLLDTLKDTEGGFDPFEILEKVNTDYAIPINRAVDYVRKIKETVKKQSYIAKEHPDIIKFMNDIIGGDVSYSRNSVVFVPNNNKRLRLKLNEGSSSVRSLVDLFIYLKHSAQKGDLLMIDEPELNLHPENQRKLMQLFAQLIRTGIKIYITTHSDYIVKELNNIILLHELEPSEQLYFFEHYGYNESQLLSKDQVSVYIASFKPILLEGNTKRTKCNSFQRADFNGYGFVLESFDNTIDVMNEIQDKLFYGDLE